MARKQFVPTREMEEAELAWRDLAREHLADFGEYVDQEWFAYGVHRMVCEALEEVYQFIRSKGAEGNGYLIIEMPPQGGKTTMAVKMMSAWTIGRLPDTRIMVATYGADLSKNHSEETQDIVRGERYRAIFGDMSCSPNVIEVDRDTSSKSYWRINGHRGSMTAVGVGGGGMGRSFELIVVDDPYKNQAEAQSKEHRKKVSKWFKSTILTRRKKGTAIVLIHTRWTREDIIGEQERLMVTSAKAIQWKIISVPALPLDEGEYALDEADQRKHMRDGVYKPLADPLGRQPGSGVSYCPELFPAEHLEQTKATLEADGDLQTWHATYQQKPRPDEGEYFGKDDFRIVKQAPEGLIWVRYIDLALGKSARADWNTSAAVAVDKAGNIYVRDMIRVHNYYQFVPVIKATMKLEHKNTVFFVESNLFQELAFTDFISDPELVGVAIFPLPASESKESDARVVQSRAKAKKLFFVDATTTPLPKGDAGSVDPPIFYEDGGRNEAEANDVPADGWVSECIDEFIEFPAGSHDDRVDTVSRGVKALMQIVNGGAEENDDVVVYYDPVEISPV